MIPKDGINLQYLKAVLLYRFWSVAIPLFLVLAATLIYCIKAPRTFLSSTLIMVQPQEVPTDYIKSAIKSDFSSRIKLLRDQVINRRSLEKIIKEYNLYKELRSTGTLDDALLTMLRNISTEVIDEGDSPFRRHPTPVNFSVAYLGEDPVKVRDVTEAIANLFLEKNRRYRENQAASTSEFLTRELGRMRKSLRQKEELIRQFKEQNIGLLPEQMANNYQTMTQLQNHLDALNTSRQQIENRKVLLQTQSARLESLESDSRETLLLRATGIGGQTPPTLEQLRLELKAIKSRYSDRHPDVLRLKASIAKREKQLKSDSSMDSGSKSGSSSSELREDIPTQVEMANKQIEELKEEIQQTKKQIEEYRRRIEIGPKVEQQYVDLRRDYKEASDNYQSLLEKKLQADLAENLELTQQGEQFTILERPFLPRKPFQPKVPEILGLGFILALACGCGLAFCREYVDQTFWWSGKELENAFEFPVLVSIPVITDESERRTRLFKRIGTFCTLISMAFVISYLFFILWKTDPTFLPV